MWGPLIVPPNNFIGVLVKGKDACKLLTNLPIEVCIKALPFFFFSFCTGMYCDTKGGIWAPPSIVTSRENERMKGNKKCQKEKC